MLAEAALVVAIALAGEPPGPAAGDAPATPIRATGDAPATPIRAAGDAQAAPAAPGPAASEAPAGTEAKPPAAAVKHERFEDVAFRLSTKPVDDAVRGMRAFVDESNGSDDAARGLVWLARKELERGDRAAARADLAEGAGAQGEARFQLEALRLLAAMDAEDGRFGEAEHEARRLSKSDDVRQAAAGQRLLDELEGRRRHRLFFDVVLGLLLLDVVVRAARAGRRLWPPPFEVQVTAPVLALLAIVGVAKGVKEVPALVGLAVGGAILAWARGAHRAARPLPSPALRAADAAFALVESLAFAWVLFDAAGLVDKLTLFFTAGPA